ncbi:acetylglutamate kinase [Dokdonia sinensis]|uniref:Acetylglutamate kinase n=1 Tax=Dokdonia sinensis TaxID=2479847 RepID=A0A3M0FW02_9FLAO|nr:acetylglutamate kinase [Dokdonia sinensis]RMB56950.1 acetylglutamate kinase [Dokdonia sinensis]
MVNKQQLTVVKIGGDIVDNDQLLQEFYNHFKKISGPTVLVHGGGNKASALQKELGIEPKKVDGRRITDAATLEVVTMVYAGLLNKKLVAGLQATGKNAIGLSGADGDAIRAHKRSVADVDYGFAGDIDRVNFSFIDELLSGGYTPVFSAITHDGKGQLLNTNADTLAARVATAMSSKYNVQLYYCFTKAGVLEDVENGDSLVERMDSTIYAAMKSAGQIVDGMIPKLDTAFEALSSGVLRVHVGTIQILSDNTQKHTTLCL